MKLLITALFACLTLAAQDPVPVPKPASAAKANPSKEEKEALRRFNSVSARATANFASADSIDASLRQWGVTLHPQLIALRVRIEAALKEAQSDLDHGEIAEANAAMDRAMGFLDQFARRLGGD
jgi:hypothetical protein